MNNNETNTPDINIILIWDNSTHITPEWVHKDLYNNFKMGDDGCDQDMHILGLNDKWIAFKSKWLDERYSKYFAEIELTKWKSEDDPFYSEEYIDIPLVSMAIWNMIMLDKTKDMRKIKKELKSCQVTFFTSDCGFWHDEESNEWGYDT